MKLKLKEKNNKKLTKESDNNILQKKIIKYIIIFFIITFFNLSGYIVYKYYDQYFQLKELKKENIELINQSKTIEKTLKNSQKNNIIKKEMIIEKLFKKQIDNRYINNMYIKYQITNNDKKLYINDIIIRYNKKLINTKKKLIIFLAVLYEIDGVEKIVDLNKDKIELVYTVPLDIKLDDDIVKENR